MARLVAEEGPLAGQVFPVDPGVTIGRENHNDIPMPANRKASRDHCKVWREAPGRYAVADLGSTNGTLLNDERITRTTIKEGDQLRIGDVLFRFELDEDEKPKPKAPAAGPRPDLASVLRGEARPTAPPKGTGAAEGASIEIKQRILQYQKKGRRGTVLGWDLSQMSGLTKWVLILLAVGFFVGLFVVTRNLVTSSRQVPEGVAPAPTDEAPAD